MWLLVAAVLAQLADLATRPEWEANPLVVGLGPSATPAKLLLVAAIILIGWVLARQTHRPSARLGHLILAGTALVAGSFGTATNILTTIGWHP